MRNLFRCFLIACLFSGALLHAQNEITNVVYIPLYHPTTGATDKWGIYLTIGDGATPGLFEFDTGGTGFYAAYATNTASPWWGTDFQTNNPTNGTNTYDSGLSYYGATVTSSVTFWSNSSTVSGLVSPNNVLVGQSTNISQNGTNYWTESQSTNAPAPINHGAFDGDFGMALNAGSNALVNIIAQMRFTNGVIPGFLINAPLTGTGGYLQIGLTAAQTNSPNFNYFVMNPDTNNSGSFNNNTNITYKSEQIFNATMTLSNSAITNQNGIYSTNIGITTDTGAVPALHNTTNDPSFPINLVSGGGLTSGVSFTLSATNINGNTNTLITSFTTASGNDYSSNLASVSVQNKGSNSTYTNYYYNTGLFLFNSNQVIYDLQNGTIGFGPTPVPEPSMAWLMLSGIGAAFLSTVRRKIKNRHVNRSRAAGMIN